MSWCVYVCVQCEPFGWRFRLRKRCIGSSSIFQLLLFTLGRLADWRSDRVRVGACRCVSVRVLEDLRTDFWMLWTQKSWDCRSSVDNCVSASMVTTSAKWRRLKKNLNWDWLIRRVDYVELQANKNTSQCFRRRSSIKSIFPIFTYGCSVKQPHARTRLHMNAIFDWSLFPVCELFTCQRTLCMIRYVNVISVAFAHTRLACQTHCRSVLVCLFAHDWDCLTLRVKAGWNPRSVCADSSNSA